MITCPWCGTSYLTFQSNCQNCGGPLAPPQPIEDEESLPIPPPPPRPISERYLWRILAGDSWAIVAFILGLIGVIFFVVGLGLTLGIVTAFVGIPFIVLGVVLCAAAGALGLPRYKAARQTVSVLRLGEPVEGRIANLEENRAVSVNGRSPWKITYAYHVQGREYTGSVSTLNLPGPALQPGKPACVLSLPNAPEKSALYPHP